MVFRYLLPLFALLFIAGAKKPPEVTVRFHLQANQNDGSSFIMPMPSTTAVGAAYIKKIPELSERDVDAIYPFPAQDGTLGCSFKLDRSGSLRLDTVSIEERGRVLVGILDTRVVTAMVIDRRVADGVITIPNGLTPSEVAKLENRFHILGQPRDKKKDKRNKNR